MRKMLGLMIVCLGVVLAGCASNSIDPVTTDPTHFYEEVREDFLIDAEVISFPGGGTVTVYEATPRTLTQEQINNFLAANGDAITEWTNLLDPNHYYGYTANTSRNGFFRHSVSNSIMQPGSMDYSNSAFNRWCNANIYFGQAHFDGNAQYAFAHLFMEPKDFIFATAQEALGEVQNQLAILGFDNLLYHRTLYIDHDILANKVTPALKTGEWQALTVDGIPTYDDWSEADDGYIFEFLTGVDGIPLSYWTFINDTYNYNADTVQVWYQPSGIVYLSAAFSLWDLGDPVESISQLVSATEALSVARIKLENTKIYTNTVINKVSGEYIYVSNDDRFSLRPAWVIYASYQDISTGITTQKCVVIDAVTGDELM